MKTNLRIFAVGLAGCLGLMTFNSRADLEVSASFAIHAEADFDVPLATHGAWVTVGSYGRCWRPARVSVGWRPYCDGRWVWTDCGWYWQSDEPWAWACYHYGNWVYDSGYGWIWMPGIEWAPAWVTWRVGGGYIGWAPCAPPRVTVALGAPHFVFVQSARFHEPLRPSRVVVNNTTIINNTTVINNIRHENRTVGGTTSQKVVVNEGPGVEVVQKASGKRLAAVKIQEAAQRTRAPANLVNKRNDTPGKGKSVNAPAEQPKTITPERKPAPESKPRPSESPRYRQERRNTAPGQGSPPAVPPPDKDKKPDDIAPVPGQPGSPPTAPSPSPKQKGKKPSRGESEDKERHGKDKP